MQNRRMSTSEEIALSDDFAVVTDVGEIAELNMRLARQLRKRFLHQETREITYPSGHHAGTVFFESSAGTSVRAWSPRNEPDKLMNFVLSAAPSSTKWIEISVQLNFPAATYNRRMAGAFVRDGNGDFFIAHRGKLTKGNAGLPKDLVFREFAARTVDAEDSGLTSRVILISGLDDPALADRLWEFADEARVVATKVSEERRSSGGGSKAPVARDDSASRPTPLTPAERLLKLRDYFDEYSGQGASKGHGGGRRTVEHGDVVKALEALVRSRGSSQKAQAIDLAVVAGTEVDLFEVKTSARTTDVYTGVGQLLIHGECITELLGLPVARHLVLPELPKADHAKHISQKGSTNIVTFRKEGSTYQFDGLP
jgi:hypothetical protein